MPVSEYFKGHGEEVMRSMTKKHGEKEGKRIFYATANKRNMNRPGKKHSPTGPSEHAMKHMRK